MCSVCVVGVYVLCLPKIKLVVCLYYMCLRGCGWDLEHVLRSQIVIAQKLAHDSMCTSFDLIQQLVNSPFDEKTKTKKTLRLKSLACTDPADGVKVGHRAAGGAAGEDLRRLL